MSNFWIHSDELIGWVYDQTINVINIVLNGEAEQLIKIFGDDVQKAINNNDKNFAQILIQKINKKVNNLKKV